MVFALVLSSPGFQPYQALAQSVAGSVSGAATPAAVFTAIPVAVQAPVVGLGAPAAAPTLSAGLSLAPAAGVPTAPRSAAGIASVAVPFRAAAPRVGAAAAPAGAASAARTGAVSAAPGGGVTAARAGSVSNARTISAAVVAATGELAPAPAARGESRTTGSILTQAAKPASAPKDAGPEAAVESVARPFEGSAARRDEAGVVAGSEIAGRATGLSRAAAAVLENAAAAVPQPEPAPQQAPKRSPMWRAAVKVAALAGVFLALDWGVKWALVTFGGPIVYHAIVPGRAALMKFSVPAGLLSAAYFMSLVHARQGPAQWLESFKKKHPAIGAVVKAILAVALLPIGLGEKRYVGDLAERHPVIRKLQKWADVAIAGMIAATIGNGFEALINGRVVDFIPFGHARANIADMLIFFGMPLLWMTLDFFGAARTAEQTRQPAEISSWKYYAMPLVGVAAFMLSTWAGFTVVPAAAWYVVLFSSLFGLGVLASDGYLHGRLREFNRIFRPTDSLGAKVAPVASRMSFGYRLRKRAAAALAAVGLAVGAPRLTAPDYEALLQRFREAPPKLVIMDYDDTFMDNHDGKGLGVTPEKLAVIERLNASGIRVAFATNRPLDGGSWAMSAMLMERMPESMRKNFIISTGGGAEVYQYGPNGEKPRAAARSNPLTAAEFADLKRMLRAQAAKLGLAEFREDAKGYEYTAVFKPRESRIKELFPVFEKAVRKAGYDFSVTLKTFDSEPEKQDLEPYIRVSKSSKSMAIQGILELIAAEGGKLEPEDVLMIGDDFTVPGYDSAMSRALPQGTALAVGAGADARLANTVLLPKVGPEQTVDFLNKIVK